MNEARIESLANFLNIEKKEINPTNVDTQYESGNKRYVVLSKKEVKQDWFSFAKNLDCLMTDKNFSIYRI